jgi:hypothetical protein
MDMLRPRKLPVMCPSAALLALWTQCHGAGAITAAVSAPATVATHGVHEIVLRLAPTSSFAAIYDEDGSRGALGLRNPYLEELVADFSHGGSSTEGTGDAITLSPSGFYDSGGIFRVRFSPPRPGAWSWNTRSSIAALHQLSGSFFATPAVSRGCPRTSPGKLGFVYPNGSTFTPVGTTCYAWVHQNASGAEGDPDLLEQHTLANLKASPFNKVRMTGFPKWYPFTHHEPRYYPFQGRLIPPSKGCHPPPAPTRNGHRVPNTTVCGKSGWDFTRFAPDFWTHFDARVAEVAALGIVPEIILFHPYDNDHWGYDRINRRCGVPGSTSAGMCTGKGATTDCLWCDEHYIRYRLRDRSMDRSWNPALAEMYYVSETTWHAC